MIGIIDTYSIGSHDALKNLVPDPIGEFDVRVIERDHKEEADGVHEGNE